MTPAEKRSAIAFMQKRIDDLPWESTIPFPYCAVCFDRLTEHNILEESDPVSGTSYLVDVCLDCKDK